MKIVVVGSGYVGLVTGACFAEMGNSVVCVDVDKDKIEGLRRGVIPIYEPGLEEMVVNNQKKGHLRFETQLSNALPNTKFVFIAVGTPMGEDGSADLRYVLEVAKEIGKKLDTPTVVVNKSTVPVGTADKVRETIQRELNHRKGFENLYFDVVSNPEFLKEGAAIKDFMKPDRVVVGAEKESSIRLMRNLYAPFFKQNERFISMDTRSSEMTKYAANAMLATKISFMNEMANICERVGADVNQVRIGIGSDSRIGYSFIYPGIGYGGSCFPKDVRALIKTAENHAYSPQILEAVEDVNAFQKGILVKKLIQEYGEELQGKTFAIWGLSFKPETDDMRESAALVVVRELLKRKARVKVYDPKAMDEAKAHYFKDLEVEYASTKYEACQDVNALLLLTEWKEFRSPDFEELNKLLKDSIIFDGRNQYNQFELNSFGIKYIQIGK